MAPETVSQRKCHPVVAPSAELALPDADHADGCCPRLCLKDLWMTDVAGKPEVVRAVREEDIRHKTHLCLYDDIL